MTNKALILIDFINEIVNLDGKLAGKGYPTFIEENGVQKNVECLLKKFRANKDLVVHVGVGFQSSYIDHPESSPLFGAAKKFGALNITGWGCQFVDYANPEENEAVIRKSRVSAFYQTNLDLVLRNNQIEEVYIVGCATDLAVQSAARDAHDRDYKVIVIEDACAAANADDHNHSIEVLSKIANVKAADSL